MSRIECLSNITFDRHSGQIEIHRSDAKHWRVSLIVTGGEVAMTGERLKRVAAHLDSHYFCLIHGDWVSDVDLSGTIAGQVWQLAAAGVSGGGPKWRRERDSSPITRKTPLSRRELGQERFQRYFARSLA